LHPKDPLDGKNFILKDLQLLMFLGHFGPGLTFGKKSIPFIPHGRLSYMTKSTLIKFMKL